jgi:DNA-binding LacI/PurR family transcriptional regulator
MISLGSAAVTADQRTGSGGVVTKPTGRGGTVTMADVAAHAGVSRALVSIVFRGVPGASEATRLDQRARLLGSSRSRTIGVVFGLQHEFHTEMVEQLYAATADTGYELALGAHAPSRPPRIAISSLLAFRCEALVLVGPTQSRSELQALAARTPLVLVGRSMRGLDVDVVRSDDASGAALAVRHLVALGHRDITYADGGRAAGAAQRRSGYRAAMTEAGLSARIRVTAGGLSEADGEQAGRRLLREGLPTAVIGFNDHCAAGLVAVCRSSGVAVPADLSVVGFDDSRIAALSTVSLTTVAQDIPALARHALERAVDRAEGTAREASQTVVAPHLVIRQTTAVPRRSTRLGGRHDIAIPRPDILT